MSAAPWTTPADLKQQLERRSTIEALLMQLGRELGDVPERIVLDPSDPTDVRDLKREADRDMRNRRE